MDPRRPACPALVPDQEGGAGKGEQNQAARRESTASTTRNGARRLSEAIRGNPHPETACLWEEEQGVHYLLPVCLSLSYFYPVKC